MDNNTSDLHQTFFSQKQWKANNIINDDYFSDKFADFQFRSKLLENLQFQANFWQIINNTAGQATSPQVLNLAEAEIKLQKDYFQFRKKFDVNGNLKMQYDYKINKMKNHTIYIKYDSNNQHALAKKNFNIGIFKHYENNGYKFKFNIENLLLKCVGRASYKIKDQNNNNNILDEYGGGGVVTYNFKTLPNIQRLCAWYKNHETQMAMDLKFLQNQEKKEKINDVLFSQISWTIYKKLNEKLLLGILMKYDPQLIKQFELLIGCKLLHWDKVECKAKIDDQFGLWTSFRINISSNAHLIISNKIDLNLRGKTSNGTTTIPLGFKLELQE